MSEVAPRLQFALSRLMAMAIVYVSQNAVAQSSPAQSIPAQVLMDDGCVLIGSGFPFAELRIALTRQAGWAGPVVVELVKLDADDPVAPMQVGIESADEDTPLDVAGAATLATGWPAGWQDSLSLLVRFRVPRSRIGSPPGPLPVRIQVRVGDERRWIHAALRLCMVGPRRTATESNLLADVDAHRGATMGPDPDDANSAESGSEPSPTEPAGGDPIPRESSGELGGGVGTAASAGPPMQPHRVAIEATYEGPASPVGEMVQRVVRRRLRLFDRCFARSGAQAPQHMVVRFTVGTRGTVSEVSLRGGTEALQQCVRATIRRFRFRPAPEEAVRLNYMLHWVIVAPWE